MIFEIIKDILAVIGLVVVLFWIAAQFTSEEDLRKIRDKLKY